jgi:putative membrane protein
VRWIVASLHLLALGIGFGAVWTRAMALGGNVDSAALHRAFRADAVWGLAALVWISTGLLRVFAGLEKGTAYYMQNDVFWGKMMLLMIILLLELWPMITLVRWRIGIARGDLIDTSRASIFAKISIVQALLIIGMVFAATAMARGYGVRL